MRKSPAAALLVLAVSLLFAAPLPAGAAQTSDEVPPPLRVKLGSPDGKPKLKVTKRLKVLSSCSNDCRAKVRMTLKTPLAKSTRSGGRVLSANGIWATWIELNRFGLNYLKKNYRKSTLKVVIRAKDSVTGKLVVKSRTFGFYR